MPQGILLPHISDQDLRGEHLVLECTISISDKKIDTQILIDIGASGYAFISDSFTQTHDLPLIPLSTSISLETFDGRPVVSGNMTHKTIFDISIGMHYERMPLLVKRLGHYHIVLGIPSLRRHDPLVKFSANSLTFNSSFRTEHCLPSQAPRFSAIQRLVEGPPQTSQPLGTFTPIETLPCQPSLQPPAMNIQMISADAFQFLAKRPGMQIFSLSIFAIDKALNIKHSDIDIQIALDGNPAINLFTKLPPEYHGYADVFFSYRVG